MPQNLNVWISLAGTNAINKPQGLKLSSHLYVLFFSPVKSVPDESSCLIKAIPTAFFFYYNRLQCNFGNCKRQLVVGLKMLWEEANPSDSIVTLLFLYFYECRNGCHICWWSHFSQILLVFLAVSLPFD